MSAIVRLVSAMCPPCVCLQLNPVSASPNLVRLARLFLSASCVSTMSALCPPRGRSLSAQIVLASGLYPLVACCGAGHEVKFCLSIAHPSAYIYIYTYTHILHARWSVSLAFILVPQTPRPLQAHPTLEKDFQRRELELCTVGVARLKHLNGRCSGVPVTFDGAIMF